MRERGNFIKSKFNLKALFIYLLLLQPISIIAIYPIVHCFLSLSHHTGHKVFPMLLCLLVQLAVWKSGDVVIYESECPQKGACVVVSDPSQYCWCCKMSFVGMVWQGCAAHCKVSSLPGSGSGIWTICTHGWTVGNFDSFEMCITQGLHTVTWISHGITSTT